jgi:hypothetical protein
MLARSFEPNQWYVRDDSRSDTSSGGFHMWVYRFDKGRELYAIGYYDPQGNWFEDSTTASKSDAVKRVHWLNGGGEGR